MTVIYVAQPNFWWRLSPSSTSRLIQQDPDVEDRRRRWPDRDQQRWQLIADGVIQVSNALANGDWTVDEEEPDHGLVRIDLGEELTRTEQRILSSWFTYSEAVSMDPWFWLMRNGRHRLWATKDLFGSEMIPVMGDALGYANPQDTQHLGEKWPSFYQEHIAELEAVEWFDAEDPQNVRFMQALRTAAKGEFPSLV